MIGIFDSGMGGIVTLHYIKKLLPEYSFLYLGDTKNLPYGEKSEEFIRKRTFECLEWMFDKGCSLVVLACNTASAFTIRQWQDEFPDKKVLSITIPGVEALYEGNFSRPMLLATKATVESSIYQSVQKRLYPGQTIKFTPIMGEGLVRLIESGASEYELVKLLTTLLINYENSDCLVLGCTHYPLIIKTIKKITKDLPIIDPSLEAAKKLVSYLKKHPKYTITDTNEVSFYVTKNVNYGYKEQLVSI